MGIKRLLYAPNVHQGGGKILLISLIKALKDDDVSIYRHLLRGMGVLPHGAIGDYYFNNANSRAYDFSQSVSAFIKEDGLEPLELEIDFDKKNFINRADKALYVSKKNGRNRVSFL